MKKPCIYTYQGKMMPWRVEQHQEGSLTDRPTMTRAGLDFMNIGLGIKDDLAGAEQRLLAGEEGRFVKLREKESNLLN